MKGFDYKKNLYNILIIFFGVVSILYSIGMKAYRATFSGFFLAIGVGLIILGCAGVYIKGKKFSKNIEMLIKFLKMVISFMLVTFIIVEALIIYNGTKSDNVKGEYLIILGAGLWGDTPSLTLRQRLDKGLEYIKEYPDTKIVLTGGKGPGETITEAEAMKRYLIKNGVEEKNIILEDKSTSTKENFEFSKEVLKNIDGRENLSVVIVTNDFHMLRSKLLAKDNGFKAYGYPSPTHPGLIVAYYVREYIAMVKTFVFDFI